MIIGTAGHIDHGKSALVEALTGRKMDPLADEQRRGITLDLHFAPFTLPDGGIAGVVDVPGHEDLVRTMVAGAAGLDLVLLVVAADEGIMPQTREHLAVVEQLRVPCGIPVITKADLVEPEWLGMIETEVASWLSASPVRFSQPMATSVRNSRGVEALRAEIAAQVGRSSRRRAADDLVRVPIDRAFSLPGTGTVVTGTAWSGSLAIGDAVRLLPAGSEGRIRSLERHGTAQLTSLPGDRVAAGIAGIDRDQAGRGQVLVRRDDPWEITRALDVLLELLPGAAHPLRHQTRIRVHLGTLEALARVSLRAPIPPGGVGHARLVLEEPAVARGGDRFVLRSYSPVHVIGGGRVLDPLPPPGRVLWPEGLDSESPRDRLRALIARRPRGAFEAQIPVLLGLSPSEAAPLIAELKLVRLGTVLIAPDLVAEASGTATATVQEWQRTHAAEPGMPAETLRQTLSRKGPAGEAALERLLKTGALVATAGAIHEAGFRASAVGGDAVVERLIAAVEAGGLTPPTVAELERSLGLRALADALRLAARSGRVVAVERDRYFGRVALAGFVEAMRSIALKGSITPGTIRDATGLTRKFVIPLLEWADASGLTIRQGDGRVPGPRLTDWR
ncbi:MAG: selenocysteine-specific translation elongation factor [Gemmatimonadota bacterium]